MARPRRGLARHVGAQPGIGGRIQQRRDRLRIEMLGHASVGRQHIAERPPLGERRLGRDRYGTFVGGLPPNVPL